MNSKRSIVQKKTGAGLAGAGSGTALVALFNALDDSNPYKKALLWSVPSISVGSGFVFHFLIVECKSRWKEYKLNREQKRFEMLAGKILADPNTSEKHKDEARKTFEEVQKNTFDNQAKRVKALSEENDQADLTNANRN